MKIDDSICIGFNTIVRVNTGGKYCFRIRIKMAALRDYNMKAIGVEKGGHGLRAVDFYGMN